ncbi:MAG: phage tail terminator protein, partial [Candidatus Thorarchaeota archaeon]
RVLDDLALYINSQNSSFTIGGSLWKGRLPDTPSTVIALVEVLGFEPPTETFGASGSFNWERPQIQVLSRAGKNEEQLSRDNSETIYKILRNLYQSTTGINGTKYHLVGVRSSPHYQGEDDNSRHYYTFTLDVMKDPSS